MKKLTVFCDNPTCKKELDINGQFLASEFMLVFKEIGSMKKPKEDEKYFINTTEGYEMQFCKDCSTEFANHVKQYFLDKNADIKDLK